MKLRLLLTFVRIAIDMILRWMYIIITYTLTTFECKHWIPSLGDVVHNVHVGHHTENFNQSKTQQIRFKVVYDASIGRLSFEKQNLVKARLIPAAVSYFNKAFFVRDIDEPIKLQRMCQGNAFFLKDKQGVGPGYVQYCKNACHPTVCGPIKVPEKFLDDCRTCDEHGNNCKTIKNEFLQIKSLIEKDFILFVSSIQTAHCSEANIVAYASYCQQEHAMNRPVAGFANLCPGKLETSAQSFESLLSTVKHEIYHALGFSVGLFAFYRDHEGKPFTKRLKNGLPEYNNFNNLYQWSDKVIKSIVRTDWSISGGTTKHEVQMIVTPTVQREVRRHFGCEDLEGAELENQGGEGTALTHWEKRVFENEAMTGTYTQHPVFSRITLALMEDTGWYKANYDMAEELDWGKKLGCLFAKNNCRAWIANRLENKLHTAPYCATLKQSPLHMRCTHSKLSLALCNLVKYTSGLPNEFRYFDRLGQVPVEDIYTYGGAVELADFCPFYQKFTLTEEGGRKRGTTCTVKENSPEAGKNFALETFSQSSKCVEHSRHWIAKKDLLTRTMLDWGSGCYSYKCTNDGLRLMVGNKSYLCRQQYEKVDIEGMMNGWIVNGSLVCPRCQDFCGDESKACPIKYYTSEFTATDIEDDKETKLEISAVSSSSNQVKINNYVMIIFLFPLFILK